MRRVQQRIRDESGMSYVFVGLGFMAFISASMLAVDVGMLMTARNQAQNAADAGALAGAVGLAFNDFDDRSPSGPAVTSAISAAHSNDVMGADVSVLPEDVEFVNDPSGEPTRVRVTVYRHEMRDNPVSLLMARFLRFRETAGVAATATAEVSPANGMTCVKPFTIPDRWIEKGEPPWTGDSTYDAFDNSGNPLPEDKADVYIPAVDANGNSNPNYSGYNNVRERGQRLVIRAGTGTNITVSFYFSLAIGGETGGDEYRWNIANCNKTVMHWGDLLVQEPGNMVGPTIAGIEELIAKDPDAFWNTSTNNIDGSAFSGQSPRVFPIPLYDPEYYDSGKRNGRIADLKVANWIGFFAESVQGNSIYGRIIPIAGIRDGNHTAPDNLFPKAIRLVE